jgi:pimeloyl-ACP methyl ester carboxylesterase
MEETVVVEFMQAMHLARADVGGWSMGGWISMKLALDHPEMVDRLVVYDAVGVRFERKYPINVFHPESEQDLDRLVHLLEPHAKPLAHFVARDAMRKFASEQWVIDRGISSMATEKDALDDRLAKMSVPLLLVWGGEDALMPLSVGETMHALDPQSELDVIVGCGHLAPAGCTDRVAKSTVQFLRADPAPVGGIRTWNK